MSLVENGLVILERICQCSFAISYYLLLEMDVALEFYEVEFSSIKNDLCQVWLKLARGNS